MRIGFTIALARSRFGRSKAGAVKLPVPLARLVPDWVRLTGDLGRGVYRSFGQFNKLIKEFIALRSRRVAVKL